MSERLTEKQHNFVTPHNHPYALDQEGRCMVCSIGYAGNVMYEQIVALRQQLADLKGQLAQVQMELRERAKDCRKHCQDQTRSQMGWNECKQQLASMKEDQLARIDAMSTLRMGYDATIAQLEAQLSTVTAERDQRKESFYADALMLRNVELLRACKECGGLGVKVYANTTTWRGGCGGQAMTNGVCDHCWGSGDRYLQWVDLRGAAQQLARFQAEIEDLRSKLQKALNH